MRLINVETYDLVEFETDVSGYAILSHTWGDEEVTFQDMHRGLDFARRKKGFTKIQGTCSRAKADGFSYAWVDTCCIDKSSSAELSEAINSMYRWYQKAEICYAFISDVHMDGIPWESQFRDSRWFTRGWTLQELLAPAELIFYSGDWVRIGSKAELSKLISSITQIDENALEGTRLDSFSIAHRLSWASRRTTKRLEDMAYCLLGIFDVNMALLYGEGERAFTRLQEEIIKTSDDHSIFAWFTKGADPNAERGLLATSPKEFEYSGGIVPIMEPTTSSIPFTMTNKGLRIALNVSLP
ncbi:heterokaryon incompatibility protein-domain-containing protein, partial [Xylogone sp. PMI_703]